MSVKSTREVAHLLFMHPSRIEQWISRDQFLPRTSVRKGTGRDWDFGEVMRLTLFVRLVDLVGMNPKVAGELTKTLHLFKDDEAFFVAYHDEPEQPIDAWGSAIIKSRDLGAFLTRNCPLLTLAWDAPKSGAAHAAVIINLGDIEQSLKNAWKA